MKYMKNIEDFIDENLNEFSNLSCSEVAEFDVNEFDDDFFDDIDLDDYDEDEDY